MKNIFLLLSIVLVFISCEKPGECFESTGDMVKRTIPVSTFTKIKVYRGISIVLTQGDECSVEVQSGSNLIDNIEITQVDNQLILKDKTTCNWLREYGQTTVYITAPNIEEIYSKTDRSISSNGVLTYPNLNLVSLDENGDGEKASGTGDFTLQLDNNLLYIAENTVSRFYISGKTNTFQIGIYNGDGRIEAQDFTVQKVDVYHRGSNDVFVKPIQSISGQLLSTGNVILKNNPPTVDVQQLYKGHLIYN